MAFIHASSPHTHTANHTPKVMQTVLLAALPGVVALTVFFGFGSISNIILASLFCVGLEALCLKVRKRNLQFYLRDYSAIVTAILIGIALPPFSAWWLILVGCFFAIVVAKHLYGGLGFNPFNPAMVAYVVLLISYPVEMTQWVSAATNLGDLVPLTDGLKQVFGGSPLNQIDGYTGATPLDVLKQNVSLPLNELYQGQSIFSSASFAGLGWEWVNLGFLAGGIYLLHKRIFTWHAPVAMLVSLTLLSMLFYDGGSSFSAGSPVFHLFSGSTMLGAFFIITDPVSSAVSNKGRLIYGACIGAIVFIIRIWGNYPDAIAFAVLLMNFAAPFIDYYTLPRTYGHTKANSGRIDQP